MQLRQAFHIIGNIEEFEIFGNGFLKRF